VAVGCRGALLLLAALLTACGSGEQRASRPAADPLLPIGAGVLGQRGYRATVYASGLKHLAAFTLDSRGRVWVAVSGATTHDADGIYLVAGAGARPVKVVGGLTAPLGLVWVGRTLLVSSLGRVTAFEDLRGTRFASRRTILRGPVAGGENNNLVVSPSGRVLMGVSASCDHCTPSSPWSATIVSFRPDGSDLRLFARGIRAPYGLSFAPGTSDLFVTMNQRDDLGANTPGDWLGVVRRGEDWGFPGCYGQSSEACADAPAPVAELDAHAAAGGVAFLSRRVALAAEWQLGKVQQVTLSKSGSTYRGTVEPFLAGLEHPLPLLATNGGVLVGDWGTGKIYRISRGD
jgi:glucose/arabinose dehydrogenase